MALHASTALPLGNTVTLSEARDFFASKPFAGYKSGLEGRQKLALAILTRIDGVTKAIGVLAKMLGRRR